MKETHVFTGFYSFMITIHKNHHIKIRFYIVKIQKGSCIISYTDRQLSKVENANCWLAK